MRQRLKSPRILKLEKIEGFTIRCMFNNGESRLLDFKEIFNAWNISEHDVEFPLLNVKEFEKVELRNYTLSWPNIRVELQDENGHIKNQPYEVGPDVLFQLSRPIDSDETKPGNIIKAARLKAGMTQEQLARRSGTTRFYISRIENNKTDIEMATFRKIIEAGLGKQLKLIVE